MNLETVFRRYAESFLTGEPAFDDSIRLKIGHSLRVRDEAGAIARAERRSEADIRLAETAGLLHDYGRFQQFSRYRTFNDSVSVNHGLLSARLLAEHRVLADFSPAGRGKIIGAARVHNALFIPVSMRGPALELAQTVRDADKIDIMEVLLAHLKQPDNQAVTWGLDREGGLSPEVADAIRQGKLPSSIWFRTALDFVAAKLGWVYDLNFDYSRSEYRRRNYIGRLAEYLPETAEMHDLCKLADRALENQGKKQYIIRS